MCNYFLDTEFIETPGHIELISIGLVSETGREYYAVNSDCDCTNADDWVLENVLRKMPEYNTKDNNLRATTVLKTTKDIRNEIYEFCGQDKGEECEFYGFYSSYDWVVFCWIFGKMIDLPSGFPKYCIDLKQMMWQLGLDSEWKHKYCPDPIGEHNALVDAKWNLKLYKLLS